MTLDEKLIRAFQELVKRTPNTLVCSVVSVDKTKQTCVVKDEDGDEYTDVRFTAIIQSGTKSSVSYPAIGSDVLVGMINDDIHSKYIVAISELENLSVEVGETSFEINKDGFDLNRNGTTFKSILNDVSTLLNDLNTEIITTQAALGLPTTETTVIATKITAINTAIKTVMK